MIGTYVMCLFLSFCLFVFQNELKANPSSAMISERTDIHVSSTPQVPATSLQTSFNSELSYVYLPLEGG